MNPLIPVTLVAAASILAACSDGETGTSPTTTTPGEIVGTGPATVVAELTATRVAYDAEKDEMIVESIPFDDDVFTGRYARRRGLDQGAYQAYVSTNGFDRYVAMHDQSDTGVVSGAVVKTDKYLEHGYQGAMYWRAGSVTIPNSTQRAFYNGDYVGLRTIATGGPMETVTGDARMEVDFSDNRVRGEIQNRRIVATTDSTADVIAIEPSITFADSTLDRDNGSFASEGNGITNAEVEGSYEGLLANGDSAASEMVGIVTIRKDDHEELGTFIAIQ